MTDTAPVSHALVMTPQELAKSIADELRSDPTRWSQGSAVALDKDGRIVRAEDPSAISWCIIGHALKRNAELPDEFRIQAGEKMIGCVWNDAPGRTVADVIALCDKVAAS